MKKIIHSLVLVLLILNLCALATLTILTAIKTIKLDVMLLAYLAVGVYFEIILFYFSKN